MGSGKTRNVTNEKIGFGSLLDDSRVSFHSESQNNRQTGTVNERFLFLFALDSPHAITRMPLVVSDYNDPNPAGHNPVEEVIRETLQICSTPSSVRRMKSLRCCPCRLDHGLQFLPKGIAKLRRNLILMTENATDVPLNGRMIANPHRPRSS